VLDGVDTTVGDFDDFVQRYERRLKRRELYEQLDGFVVVLLQTVDLLTATSETGVLVACPQAT